MLSENAIATFVYRRMLDACGLRRKVWSRVRSVLIRLLHDPVCAMSVHGRTLMMPLSHPLPDYLKRYPFYDRLPKRLGAFIRETHGALVCIDVGANVGDTIAAFCPCERDTFLAIEPNPKFNTLLRTNWRSAPDVSVSSDLCSAESGAASYTILEKRGSASFMPDSQGMALNSRTLDEIADEFASFRRVNVLKVDTDGYDLDVLAGAKKVIASARPAILFECDACGDVRHMERCLQTLEGLKTDGYRGFLVYDNYGYLMGRHALDDVCAFRDLLLYHLSGGVAYFDLLLMTDSDLDSFHASENQFFSAAPQPRLTTKHTKHTK